VNLRRVYSVAVKEWRHITRDATSFILILLSPAILLITLGYAFTIDIKDVPVAILDHDNSELSHEYIQQIMRSGELRFSESPVDVADITRLLMRGEAKAVIVIPAGFGHDLRKGTGTSLQVIVDGTDPNTAGHAIRYIGAYTEDYIASQAEQQLVRIGLGNTNLETIDLRVQAWYNPTLRYTVSMIPALVGVVLSVPAMAASLALSKEREGGTLEILIATPIRRHELLLGKLIPYLLTGLLSVPLCIATAVYGYKVPFQGNLILFFGTAVVFLFSSMSISMFISVFAKSQQVAIIASMMIFLFSGFFLSGLLIPFSLMGPMIKLESFMLPTTHFVIISRGIIIKAQGFGQLQGYVFALLAIGIVFLSLSILMFKKKL
jgi:ABC-2 type transport system permease protein